MLRQAGWKGESFGAYRALVRLVVMVQLVIFQPVFALEALIALLALIDLLVVHYLMLLQADQCGEDLMADAADLRGARSVLILVVFESILTFEFFVALQTETNRKTTVSPRKSINAYLIAGENRLSMGDLMLLQTMGLVEAFKAVFALKLRLVRHIMSSERRRSSFRFDFSRSWLRTCVTLFMILQVLLALKRLIAKCTVEDVVRCNTLLFYLHI